MNDNIHNSYYNKRLTQDLERLDYKKYKKRKNSPLKKIGKLFIAIVIFFVIIFLIFFIKNSLSETRGSESWIDRIPVIGQIKHLADNSNTELKGESKGRINILLLGVGGENHEGSELTDTIIVASYDMEKNQISMLSIPRDLSVPIEGKGWQRINHINSYAESANPGKGGEITSEKIGQLLNAKIDYYVKIDFAGFEDVIDRLGELKIYVDNTFDDYRYPVLGMEEADNYESRFEHLHFDKGWTKMDGNLALKYSRSRHAAGIEGTDFARAARQQKVIQAVKDKALSAGTLLNPVKISGILDSVQDHVDTNMKIWEMISFWKMTQDIKEDNIINKVLSNQPNGLLSDSITEEGAFVLIPRIGNFGEIQYLFKHMFDQIPENDKKLIRNEAAKIKVFNGTWVSGLAGKTALDLENYGFNIIGISNCSKQDFETSVIYDLTYGDKKESLKLLKEKIDANVSFNLPEWLKSDIVAEINDGTSVQPDIIVILGKNSEKTYTTTSAIGE